MRFLKSFIFSYAIMATASCAVLHHVQLGDVNYDPQFTLRPFELKVSETGANFEEAGSIVKAFTGSSVVRRGINRINDILQLFQQGPRTGFAVFSDTYAKNIIRDLYKECPTGHITGIVSIREMRNYPVISGEIVKVKGYCMIANNKE